MRFWSIALHTEMATSKVAVVRTSPRTVLEDYHRLMNLAGHQDVVDRSAIDHVLVRGLAKVTCVALLAAITSNLLQHAATLLGSSG